MEIISNSNTADKWLVRCAYWQEEYKKQIPKRKRRETPKKGLVLTGNGLSINVDKGRLIIKDGFTHYPQKALRYEFFKGALDIPPRIVIVDGNGAITLDALSWLSEQKVDLIRVTYDGRVQSIISKDGSASDPKLLAWQFETQRDEYSRVKYATELISKKIKESKITLRDFLPESEFRDKGVIAADKAISEINNNPPETVGQLLAVEGNAAQTYFYAWRALDLNWKNTKAHPIPENWKRFFSRSSLFKERRGTPGNRHATHPINAMLNYVYGVLEGRVRIDLIAEGYSPGIGILHNRPDPERHSFVFDRMEPLRPVADRAVLNLVETETFSGADFQLQSNGVVRVNPELARRLISSVSIATSNMS